MHAGNQQFLLCKWLFLGACNILEPLQNMATDLNSNNEDKHEELVDALQVVGTLRVTRDQRIL